MRLFVAVLLGVAAGWRLRAEHDDLELLFAARDEQ